MADKFAKGLFRNPETGSEINTENFTGRDSSGNTIAGGLTAENLGQQGFSQLQSERRGSGELFFGERDPITGQRYERFIQRPKGFFEPKIPGVTNTKNHSQGTESIRDENKILGDQLGGDIAGAEKGVQSNADIIADLTNMQKNIGKTTDDELKRIQEAGEAAGSAFDAQLSDALESRRRELPSDIVRAGEAGGFENTQVAGAAALLPTTPKAGESFVGAGGLLSQQRQLLDRNVSLVRAEQQRAIEAAKSAERNFQRTGKRQDFEDAKALVTLSQQLKQNEEDMLIKREQLGFQREAAGRAESLAPFQLAEQIVDTMAKVPEGQEFTVDGNTYVGTAVPESEKAFFSGSNIISLMGKLPQGETQEITDPNTGQTWNITGTKDPDTTTATDDQGNVSVINKNTGEVISRAEGVGKTKTKAASVTLIQAGQEKGAKQGIVDALNSARDKQTNVVTADAYVSQFSTFLLEGLGDIGDFRASFPPSIYLSPEEAAAVNEELATAEAGLSTLKKDEEDGGDLF